MRPPRRRHRLRLTAGHRRGGGPVGLTARVLLERWGARTLLVEKLRVQHWVMNAFVVDRFRHGRVLLAGDAAHAIPVFGGMGMNTGVADAHNLCRKLAGVLRGRAGPGVLDAYGAERHPAAHLTLRQAVANTRLALQVQSRRREQREAGAAAPALMELPWTERYFAQLGLVFGVAYRSGAVLTDPSAPPGPADVGTDYVPTAEPGHRMPHLWLAPGRSTLDAFGAWFTLVTADPTAWERRAAGAWPLRVEPLTGEQAGLETRPGQRRCRVSRASTRTRGSCPPL
ncbi:FAD-dependent monooxygenase [Streptomyces sp. IBSNAI002]|uniref:FAD-dependent monooxygenase n=1 Tax=Streptomyces sp. IBSNAI002 TaxID=3457500 RepID=UPI003FD418BC